MENLFYNKDIIKFTTKIANMSSLVKEEVSQNREVEIRLIQTLFDLQYEYVNHYVWMFQAPHIFILPDKLDVLFSAFHKNLIGMYSALKLAQDGFHGSAKFLLRHVFEYLVVSKFCVLSENNKIYESWKKEEVIYFSNGILSRIASPNNQEFKRFWSEINSVSHASRSSLQIDLDWNKEKEQIEYCFVVLHVLLECNYHLLNTHLISDSMKWHLKYHFSDSHKQVLDIKKNINALFSISKKMISKSCRKLIFDYKKSWLVK